MTPGELLDKRGIHLESTAPGRYYTTCPQCSKDRTKPGHKNAKCLGVTIDGDKVGWGCNHCGWTGPEKGSGRRERTSTVVCYYAYGEKLRKARGANKLFWWEHLDGGGRWIKGSGGADTKILYRIDEVRRAIADGRTIAVAEGEKDAESLWNIGVPATCNAHGASEPGKKPKWLKEHSACLAGADLVVFNDNDPAGHEHAGTICKQSAGVAKRVRPLDLALHWPAIPKGGDVSDYLAAGGENTPERLLALIEAAPDYVPAGSGPADTATSESPPADDDTEIERLARLPALEYDRQRIKAAEALGVRAPILDKLVAGARVKLGLIDQDDDKQGRAISFPEPEPWPEPVDGAELLNAMAAAIRKHVVLSNSSSHVAALWVLHSWLIDCFVTSPRLGVRSATKGCGKTLLLDVIGRMVRRPLRTLSITPAATFRVVESFQPSLLIDEADTFLNDNEGLRGILDGNRKGDTVLRTVGDDFEVRAFATYAAVAIALIGTLPDTLHDRSVVIDLKRRLPKEKIAPFRFDRAGHLDVLARKIARWAQDNEVSVSATDPKMPQGVINREADNWRPLAMIAAVAGGRWGQRLAKAATAAHAAGGEGEASLVERLLGDIQAVFTGKAADRIASADLVEALVEIEGHPWAEMGKARKPLTANRLAKLLKPLGIAPDTIRIGDKTSKGYLAHRFMDAFARYGLNGGSEPSHRNKVDEQRTSEAFQTVTDDPDVTVRKREKSSNDAVCYGVTVGKEDSGQNAHAMTQEELEAEFGPSTTPPREGGFAETADRHVAPDHDLGESARRPLTRDGYEVIGAEPNTVACACCGSRAGTVYLIRNPHQGVRSEPLHEHCARAWFETKARAAKPARAANGQGAGSPPPPLSDRAIRQLAAQYREWSEAQHATPEGVVSAVLDQRLLKTLVSGGVPPGYVAAEFERVMRVVMQPDQ